MIQSLSCRVIQGSPGAASRHAVLRVLSILGAGVKGLNSTSPTIWFPLRLQKVTVTV